MIKHILTTALMAVLLVPALAVAQSPDNDSGWNALYTVFPNHSFPDRGRSRIVKMAAPEVLLTKLEAQSVRILGTTAEPMARFYRGNILFRAERFEDALKNNEELKQLFPNHGLCRALFDGELSAVDQAIADIKSEIEVRKNYKVVKLPEAKLDLSAKAVFHTSEGSFEIHCYSGASPKTSANFKKLVEEGYFIGMSFNKILSFRRMTLGCPNTRSKDGGRGEWGKGGPGYDLPLEFNDALHIAGAVSMNGTANGMSHGSQFTICLHNQPELNNKQAVFGKLTSGLNVLRKLSQSRVKSNGQPLNRIEITGTQWIKR